MLNHTEKDKAWKNCKNSSLVRSINLLISWKVFPKVYDGIEFLNRCQNPDGGICGLVVRSESSLSPTAQTVRAWIAAKSIVADRSLIQQKIDEAVNYIRSNVSSWNNLQRAPKCIIALLESGVEAHDSIVQQGAKFIIDQRNDDKGWGYRKDYETTPYFTYFAVTALKMVNSNKYATYIKEGIDKIYDDLRSGKWDHTLINKAFGTLLLAETKQRKYAKIVKANVKELMDKVTEPWEEDSYITKKEPYFVLKFFTPKVLLLFISVRVFPLHRSIRKILKWLRDNQRRDGGWSWGTEQSVSWVTALSVFLLLRLAKEIEPASGETYSEAYKSLEEIVSIKEDETKLEKIIENNKRLAFLEKDVGLLEKLLGATLIGWTVFTSIVYFFFFRNMLTNIFEIFLHSHSVSMLLSTIGIPAVFLFPIGIGYRLLKGERDRKVLLDTVKKVSYFILLDVGFTALIKIIEMIA